MATTYWFKFMLRLGDTWVTSLLWCPSISERFQDLSLAN